MNVDIRHLISDAERAFGAGDPDTAIAAYVAAGDCAVTYQLYRTAVRCYRQALEIDLIGPVVVACLLRIGRRVGGSPEWYAYARALETATWPHFGCRGAQLRTADAGTVVECPRVGVVLELAMVADDRFEVRADGRFAGMPLAMAMIVLRRALWPVPREHAVQPMAARVTFEGHPQQWLDETGDWDEA